MEVWDRTPILARFLQKNRIKHYPNGKHQQTQTHSDGAKKKKSNFVGSVLMKDEETGTCFNVTELQWLENQRNYMMLKTDAPKGEMCFFPH